MNQLAQKGAILIGLVTHEASRFNDESQATDQVSVLANLISSMGFKVDLLISDRNDFSASGEVISPLMAVRSAREQAILEVRWANYLKQQSNPDRRASFRAWIRIAGMTLKRSLDYLVSRRKLRRLANIDLSHMRILERGINSNADWILIIEDDGFIENVGETASLLARILLHLNSLNQIFVNLSESISIEKLGVETLVLDLDNYLDDESDRKLVHLRAPITNTVCANLYSTRFAQSWHLSMDRDGLFPSIPIDWRLNRYILEMVDLCIAQDVDCYWVIPAPVVQGSMHERS